MSPADETAAKIEPTERTSTGAVAGSIDKLNEQLRVSVEALLHPSPPRKPVEELDDLLLAINHHLDQETSQRKAIYYRLAAIESEMKRRSSRGFARYLGHLHWCCSDLGLAILRQGSKADNRDKSPGTWLVAGDQADDRELGRAARLDAAPSWFHKHRCSAVRAANSRAHFESAHSSFSRSAPSTADRSGYRRGATSRRAAACRHTGKRRAACRRSRPDGARDHQTASRR